MSREPIGRSPIRSRQRPPPQRHGRHRLASSGGTPLCRTCGGGAEDIVRKRNVPALVIAVPPRTLADLRRAFHADVKKRIVAEVGKDLTKHPVWEIETHLFA